VKVGILVEVMNTGVKNALIRIYKTCFAEIKTAIVSSFCAFVFVEFLCVKLERISPLLGPRKEIFQTDLKKRVDRNCLLL
jgi:hypothetical protein